MNESTEPRPDNILLHFNLAVILTKIWRHAMIGVYFSGTGNTKFCVDKFIKEYDHSKNSFSIEDNETLEKIKKEKFL